MFTNPSYLTKLHGLLMSTVHQVLYLHGNMCPYWKHVLTNYIFCNIILIDSVTCCIWMKQPLLVLATTCVIWDELMAGRKGLDKTGCYRYVVHNDRGQLLPIHQGLLLLHTFFSASLIDISKTRLFFFPTNSPWFILLFGSFGLNVSRFA